MMLLSDITLAILTFTELKSKLEKWSKGEFDIG